MSLRLRLIVFSSLAVAAAIALVSVVVYVLVSNALHRELKSSLEDRAAQAIAPPKNPGATLPPCSTNVTQQLAAQLATTYFQIVYSSGARLRTYGPLPKNTYLPVARRDRLVALGRAENDYRDATTTGKVRIPVKVYTVRIPSDKVPYCALQVARPLDAITHPLQQLAVVLFIVSLGGVGLAAVFGWIVAGTALGPVRHLTEASEHVARTRDLSRRIQARGHDELARLASAFNTMLEALDVSLRSQRQLVADASHELRTPLTTAKTNIEVLRRAQLSDKEEETILSEVGQQIDELAVLVTDIVDLARGVEPDLELEEIRLDLLVDQVVDRARRLYPKNAFEVETVPCIVLGVPSRLERAVTNLLDNACKWSPPEAPIEVSVRDSEIRVRDHGSGIEDADLPFIFDRFYRSRSARALPGSGLGLAIVRQVAESHGGQVLVERPSDGGTVLRIVLPCVD